MTTRDCGLCGDPVETSLCKVCTEDLDFLNVPLPSPTATHEEVRAWAKENKVTLFACGKSKR